jgi:hypothetical protein
MNTRHIIVIPSSPVWLVPCALQSPPWPGVVLSATLPAQSSRSRELLTREATPLGLFRGPDLLTADPLAPASVIQPPSVGWLQLVDSQLARLSCGFFPAPPDERLPFQKLSVGASFGLAMACEAPGQARPGTTARPRCLCCSI